MSTIDTLLTTLLRSLHIPAIQQDTPRLLSTAAHLLTTLTNPHNLTLLTAHLLRAPALWDHPAAAAAADSRFHLRLLSLFHAAGLRAYEDRCAALYPSPARGQPSPLPPSPQVLNVTLEEWVKAVVTGADERSARWRHMLVLGGLLLGIEAGRRRREEGEEEGRQGVGARPRTEGVRMLLEDALVQATALAVEEVRWRGDAMGGLAVALVLNHVFPVLSEGSRARLDWDGLLPVLVAAAYFEGEGLEGAYFLGAVDGDVVPVGKRLNWPARAPSFERVEGIASRSLVSGLGPLSRLIAHAVENARDSGVVERVGADLAAFARSLMTQWRQNRISGVDSTEEMIFLHEEARTTTLPVLWRVLRSALFSVVIVLRSIVARTLGDSRLASDEVAPAIAAQTLHTLRSLYFISVRLGAHAFSQHTFVYLSAIDILANYPLQAESFLKDIQPESLGHIPPHPLDRTLDLYFLNTAEHFTLILSPTTNETLLLAAATPYLAASAHAHLLRPILEAAHALTLAVLSAPHSGTTTTLTATHLPFYVAALFAVFPRNLSPRQFRVAFRTLIRVTSPPAPLAACQPDTPAVLMELLHHRALTAPTTPLDAAAGAAAVVAAQAHPPSPSQHQHQQPPPAPEPPLSEQAVLTLTLLDALPYLPVPLLEEWLDPCADLVGRIADPAMRDAVRRRFWEVLVGGEMEPEKGVLAVGWWNGRGGREKVLGDAFMMSGGRESKL